MTSPRVYKSIPWRDGMNPFIYCAQSFGKQRGSSIDVGRLDQIVMPKPCGNYCNLQYFCPFHPQRLAHESCTTISSVATTMCARSIDVNKHPPDPRCINVYIRVCMHNEKDTKWASPQPAQTCTTADLRLFDCYIHAYIAASLHPVPTCHIQSQNDHPKSQNSENYMKNWKYVLKICSESTPSYSLTSFHDIIKSADVDGRWIFLPGSCAKVLGHIPCVSKLPAPSPRQADSSWHRA